MNPAPPVTSALRPFASPVMGPDPSRHALRRCERNPRLRGEYGGVMGRINLRGLVPGHERRERALEARVAMVTKEELDLAGRAAELAARERRPRARPLSAVCLVRKGKTVDNPVYGSCVGDSVAAEPSGTMASPSTDGRASRLDPGYQEERGVEGTCSNASLNGLAR